MIFVDTGAWYALATPTDPDHDAAKDFVESSRQPLITSDYIVDELLTLFIARGEKSKGIEWVENVLLPGGVDLVRVSVPDFQEAIDLYSKYAVNDGASRTARAAH